MVNDVQLCNTLIKVNDTGKSQVMVVGDFNFPEINWETDMTTKSANHCSQRFLDMVRDSYFFQNITQPTGCRHGQTLGADMVKKITLWI